ncbi:hypothetical protein GALL_538850 [mine drainage metagenome]|uniref:Uncharacterized protein n=1 Tax=mine drainage metagenome TaxID=410659 RepID=A0A1J5PAT0_9ZZZZ
MPGCTRTSQFLLAPVLLFIALARRLQIDAEKSRTDQGKNNRGSDRAENVGYGVSDRHRIQQFPGFLGREAEAMD